MPEIVADLRLLEAAGIGRYLRQVAPRLTGLVEASYLLLGDTGAMRRQGLEDEDSFLLQADAPIYSVAEQLELRRLTPRDAELFWAPHYNIPLLRSPRLLVTVHDVLHLARPEFAPGLHRRAYARLMFSAVRRRAAAIACDSRFTADELVRLTGVDRRSITVVYPGLEPWWFEPATVEAPHPRPYFVCVGNLKPHKNLPRAIAAFATLADTLSHDLVLIGKRDGFLTGDPSVAAAAGALDGRVHLVGEVDDGSLRAYLARATALIFPSLYEGFGLPPLEAMASGCAVVASRAASIPEVCGDAARYVDPLDIADLATAMRELAESRQAREELRERGRAHARAFTAERCAAETAGIMGDLIG